MTYFTCELKNLQNRPILTCRVPSTPRQLFTGYHVNNDALPTARLEIAMFGFFITLLTTLAAPAKPHWAFVPPVRPAIPSAKSPWIQNPIDSFVLKSLSVHGLKPNPPADKRTLLRRLTFDLTGLPPTPTEVHNFLADNSPTAYASVVKRLLASPAFGERWAQHWLDVVRFAETNGYEHDLERPQAWRYRDWVVKSLNDDLPYNQFLKAQIAGDLIAPDRFEMRVATGFLRAGPQHLTGGNQDEPVNRQEWLTEAVSSIGSAVLGVTIQCARCHDHKYDPMSQADFYRLQAFFGESENHDFVQTSEPDKQKHETDVVAWKSKLKPIEDQISAIEKPYNAKLRAEHELQIRPEHRRAFAVPSAKRTPAEQLLVDEAGTIRRVDWTETVAALGPADRERRAGLRKHLHEIELEEPLPIPAAEGVADVRKTDTATHIFKRGDPHVPGQIVLAGFPGAVAPSEPSVVTGGRRALADWIARPENPLTARVMVNRMWRYLFGKGIVSTPNDFGLNGKRPSNQELLDYLATEFSRSDTHLPAWSIKRMIEAIVTSSAYRQSTVFDPAKSKIDPENIYLWRANRRRLDAEAVRDAVMQAAGTTNLQVGGPPVRVPLEPEVVETVFIESEADNLWPITPDVRQHTRRSLYLLRKRNVRVPMLTALDQPDMMSSCAARGESVHALQSLTLMNSPFMVDQSKAFARRLMRDVPNNETARIGRMYELCFGRLPNAREMALTVKFLKDQRAIIGSKSDLRGVWTDLCLATLNLNEFVYIR